MDYLTKRPAPEPPLGDPSLRGLVQHDFAERAPDTSGRKPEIALHIDEQTKLIEELSINLSEVEERLSPVMGPLPPGDSAEGKQPLTTKTRLGNVLEEDNRRLGHLISRLILIKKRLEL